MLSATNLLSFGLILLAALCVTVLFLVQPEEPSYTRPIRQEDAEDDLETAQLPRVSDATTLIPVQQRKLPPVR